MDIDTQINNTLINATLSHDLHEMESAIKDGADVNARNGLALRIAVNQNHLQCVIMLRENGAEWKYVDEDTWRYAYEEGHFAILTYAGRMEDPEGEIDKRVKELIDEWEKRRDE